MVQQKGFITHETQSKGKGNQTFNEGTMKEEQQNPQQEFQLATIGQYPKAIYDLSTTVYNLQIQIDAQEDLVRNYKDRVLDEVTALKDFETGKPQFTNDKTRKAERDRILSESDEYTETVGSLEPNKVLLAQSNMELERLRKEFTVRELNARLELVKRQQQKNNQFIADQLTKAIEAIQSAPV